METCESVAYDADKLQGTVNLLRGESEALIMRSKVHSEQAKVLPHDRLASVFVFPDLCDAAQASLDD